MRSVDREAADDSEMRHAHHGIGPRFDDRHASAVLGMLRPTAIDFDDEAVVDFTNNFHHSRQQLLHQAHRPALERLGQQGVIGIGHAATGDFPRGIPFEGVDVHQQAHQFGNRDARVGIVQLEAVLVGEALEIFAMAINPLAQHVLKAGRSEKVLLAQSQFLTVFAGIVGIQHHGDVFRRGARGNGLGITAGVELFEIEFIVSHRRPQAQGIDGAVVIARYRNVERHGQYVMSIDPAYVIAPEVIDVVFAVPAKMHCLFIFGTFDFPGMTATQPGIGFLYLVAGRYILAEHAVLIANAVADHRQAEGRTTVEKAGGETAETTVAEPGIVLLRADFLVVKSQLVESFGEFCIEVQV